MLYIPLPEIRLRKMYDGEAYYVFDDIRGKWIKALPEEEVRQKLILFLTQGHHYPRSLISVEKRLAGTSSKKRTDLVIYGRDGNPFMLIECKAPKVKISMATVQQAAYYNRAIKAPHLLLSNGRYLVLFSKKTDTGQWIPSDVIPDLV